MKNKQTYRNRKRISKRGGSLQCLVVGDVLQRQIWCLYPMGGDGLGPIAWTHLTYSTGTLIYPEDHRKICAKYSASAKMCIYVYGRFCTQKRNQYNILLETKFRYLCQLIHTAISSCAIWYSITVLNGMYTQTVIYFFNEYGYEILSMQQKFLYIVK